MGEAQEKQLNITISEDPEGKKIVGNPNVHHQELTPWTVKYKKWLEVGIISFIILASQATATLLGRVYYEKGGKSRWTGSLVQVVGFPILLPFLWMNKATSKKNKDTSQDPSIMTLILVYTYLGVLNGGAAILCSSGLSYIPVSTFSLICASQLAFNAFFSFFLNSQKITPLIANCIVLLTISSIVLVLQPSSKTESSKGENYVIGFVFALTASIGIALLLSSTQFICRKILKRTTMKEMVDIVIYQSFTATCMITIGLFASGEWKELKVEIQEFEMGKMAYVMTLFWAALSWQVNFICLLGLIMKVSALFANVISTLSVPLIPILAVIIFHEKMSGLKIVSMILAMWGFASYIYQQYLDESKVKGELLNGDGRLEVSLVQRD